MYRRLHWILSGYDIEDNNVFYCSIWQSIPLRLLNTVTTEEEEREWAKDEEKHDCHCNLSNEGMNPVLFKKIVDMHNILPSSLCRWHSHFGRYCNMRSLACISLRIQLKSHTDHQAVLWRLSKVDLESVYCQRRVFSNPMSCWMLVE